MIFENRLNNYAKTVNDRLAEVFKEESCLQKPVYDAMSYSALAGGKRLRPVICLAVCDMLGGEAEDALRFAVGIECIHTYSLIHDDLPCMDNDDLRRGRPTCHKQFDEATALLAGDGLLTYAFEHMTDFSAFKKIDAVSVLKIVNEIAKGAGCSGMIGGQVVDLANEGKSDLNQEVLTYTHNLKTGELIRISAYAGGVCSGADDEQLKALKDYALNLGLAFQIQDDILDCIGDTTVLGKPIGSDALNEKTTYVTLLGLDGAKEKVRALTDKAINALNIFNDKAEFLTELANYLIDREN